MKIKSTIIEQRKVFLLIAVLSTMMTIIVINVQIALGSANGIANTTNLNLENYIEVLAGSFAPLISISANPMLALTGLSFLGNLFNSNILELNSNPFFLAITELPISNWLAFGTLFLITLLKFVLSLLPLTKVLSDATIGRLEDLLGKIISLVNMSLIISITTVHAAEITASSFGDNNIITFVITNIISFIIAALSYIIYIVVKTLIFAIDIFAFIFSPIPGANAVFVIAKHIVILLYTFMIYTDPLITVLAGLFLLIIACLFFRKARRIELYYRKVYIIPFYNAIFRRKLILPLIPKKISRSVRKEFMAIDIMLEAFVINKYEKFYKRELCYFINSGNKNYLFKKRFLGKKIKIELQEGLYLEKCFRFLRIFSDEDLKKSKRKVLIVIRREHNKNLEQIMKTANLINYNELCKERKQHKNQEKTERKKRKFFSRA